MAKYISIKSGWSSVLIWSVISAAFIGPGTVTTCAKSGAQFGYTLIWALSFSTIATILLQELVARIHMATGKSIGQIIALKYQSQHSGRISKGLFFAVTFGCAAYQAGNVLGAIAGLRLIYPLPSSVYAILILTLCFLLLSKGTIAQVSKIMGGLVFMMGIVFFYLLCTIDFSWKSILYHSVMPSIPSGSGSLLIGLVGTTIVPYNLFLASGIQKGQSLKEMRFGITIAVLIGGLISIAILISGTLISDPFSYAAVFKAIEAKTGAIGAYCFALGLFAAGFSSAITAPLAAAVCGQSLLGEKNKLDWNEKGKFYAATWKIILAIGGFFGFINVQPIPAIIAAQGINGLLLPIVCLALYLTIQDQSIMPEPYRHSNKRNMIYLIIIWITCFLGLYNIQKALLRIIQVTTFSEFKTILFAGILSSVLILLLHHDARHTFKKPGSV